MKFNMSVFSKFGFVYSDCIKANTVTEEYFSLAEAWWKIKAYFVQHDATNFCYCENKPHRHRQISLRSDVIGIKVRS